MLVHDSLEWWKDVEIESVMSQFKKNIIWNHIFKEELKGLHFLSYLDFLRVSNHNYIERTVEKVTTNEIILDENMED